MSNALLKNLGLSMLAAIEAEEPAVVAILAGLIGKHGGSNAAKALETVGLGVAAAGVAGMGGSFTPNSGGQGTPPSQPQPNSGGQGTPPSQPGQPGNQ